MLTKLRVKNYKSLEDVTVPLRPLTVFVGPNNAGKSNILDCLLFLRELLELGPSSVHSRGGFQYLVWGGDLKRQIEIELETEILDSSDREHEVTYRVEIAGGPKHYAIALLELVVDVFESASRKIQILVTTHSPDLLNFLDPEDLMIVEKVNGKTQCREAKDIAGVRGALKTLGLGELWHSGHLGGVP